MNLKQLETKIKELVTKSDLDKKVKVIRNDIKKDVEIVLLRHVNEQRGLNDSLYADKEVENVIKWIVRITTGGIIAGAIGLFLAVLLGVPVL